MTLFQVNDARFWLRMAEQGLLFVVGLALVFTPNVFVRIIGTIVLGVVYARNLEFVHECLHGTALRNKGLGNFIGRLLALPMFVSFAQWRIEHAQHHRDVRREGFRYEYERLHSFRELILHIFMIRHFRRALRQMFQAAGTVKPAKIDIDHRAMLAVLFLGATLSIAFHSPFVLWIWLLPLIPAALIHTHIELPEHFGCKRNTGDAFLNSRIILANRFVTWFVNANNYHALHHWNPRIPNDLLPLLYKHNFCVTLSVAPLSIVSMRTKSKWSAVEVQAYTGFFKEFYAGIFRSSFARAFGARQTYSRLRRD